ncbi:hypothetical protein [Cyanobium sp. ATX 6A2]|uniref:hypothetical protein n=1 Tax=Cyanobium sp. ATX 6A2 TaxID=2823700 RepID=UPI0020CEB7AA|nr:hypothetical protein [Cyanobium sp. ATX 6A2]
MPMRSPEPLENIRVIPGLDHVGDSVLTVELQFRVVHLGVDPNVLSQAGPAVRRALWAIGERRFPHLRYDVHPDQHATARQLAQWHERRPRQAHLRRDLSTAYDALLHGLASHVPRSRPQRRHQADDDPNVRFRHNVVTLALGLPARAEVLRAAVQRC